MFEELDPLLHTQIRLSIMSILVSVKSAEFNFLLKNIPTTKGNLSYQLTQLSNAGYIQINKSFRGKYPLTTCMITVKGIDAYERYIQVISEYFRNYNKNKAK